MGTFFKYLIFILKNIFNKIKLLNAAVNTCGNTSPFFPSDFPIDCWMARGLTKRGEKQHQQSREKQTDKTELDIEPQADWSIQTQTD